MRRLRGQSALATVPEVLVQQLTDARRPFREGKDLDVDPCGAQLVGQQPALRGLASSIWTFERDQHV